MYGSGDGSDLLAQREVRSRIDNGIAVEPSFWSLAGFATLVSSNDNEPARCDGRVADGAITWTVPRAAADLCLTLAPTIADGARSLLDLTGRPPVPPRGADVIKTARIVLKGAGGHDFGERPLNSEGREKIEQ